MHRRTIRMVLMTKTMLLGTRCNLTLADGTIQLVTFLGFDAGDARVQLVGTSKSFFVSVRSISPA